MRCSWKVLLHPRGADLSWRIDLAVPHRWMGNQNLELKTKLLRFVIGRSEKLNTDILIKKTL